MLKILVINTVEFELNGISTVIMNYYNELDKSNLKIDFIANNKINEKFKKSIEERHDKIYILKNRKKNPIAYFLNLMKIMKKNNYDIVHIHGNSSLMQIELTCALMASIPMRIVHAHSTECDFKILNRLLYPIFKISYNKSLACSKAAGEWLYKNNDFDVLNNGIECKRFKFDKYERNKLRKELSIDDKFVILHVGCFNEGKNQRFLIDIFEEICKFKSDVALILIGEGPTKELILNEVKKKKIDEKVIFIESTNNIEKYMWGSDVLVFPSLHEGLGIVNIEAQATGLRCIVSDAVPMEARVTDNITFLPLNKGKEIWVEEILKYSNECKRENMYLKVADSGFDIKVTSSKLLKIYKECYFYLNKE